MPLLRKTPTGTSATRWLSTACSRSVRTCCAGADPDIDAPLGEELASARCFEPNSGFQYGFGSTAPMCSSVEIVRAWPGGSERTFSTKVVGSATEPKSKYDGTAAAEILGGMRPLAISARTSEAK